MIEEFSVGAMLIMAFISYFTAGISAATGMGGGVIFLVGLNLYLPLNNAIPVHGFIQLKNNAVRVFALRKHLLKEICIPYSIGCLLGVIAVTFFVKSLDSKLIPYILILSLVMYSLFKPKKLPELKIPNWGFYILGFVTGFLGILVGAVDPLLAPFFLRSDFDRHVVIANKSYFQFLIHMAKIPVFLYLGFNYLDYWVLIVVLFLSGMLGTFHGIKVLNKISQELFMKIFKVILFAVSMKIIYNIYVILN